MMNQIFVAKVNPIIVNHIEIISETEMKIIEAELTALPIKLIRDVSSNWKILP